MRNVMLGATGMSINPLVYGTLPLGPLQAAVSAGEGGRLIRHALDEADELLWGRLEGRRRKLRIMQAFCRCLRTRLHQQRLKPGGRGGAGG